MSSTMTKTSLVAAVLAMASTTSAHIFMANPVPFAGTIKSPLEASGSNFPCQGVGYEVTTMNEWTVGSDVTISFPPDQTATHGGGSCQVSVTKDLKPTKDSKWKVIHSIVGGCPTSNSKGNLDTQGGSLGTYDFTVPESLPEGELTMAWTWFNKVGNREMYMNCAPINVSGGSGKGFDSLPDMATANIGGTCKTTEGSDYTFANPGQSVAKLGSGPTQPLCGGASEGGSGGDSGAGYSAPAAPEAPAAPAAPKEPTAPAPSAPKAPASGGGSSCSSEGAIVCNGESQFGICSNGAVVYQAVAAGTKCSNGAIARRDLHRNARTTIPLY